MDAFVFFMAIMRNIFWFVREGLNGPLLARKQRHNLTICLITMLQFLASDWDHFWPETWCHGPTRVYWVVFKKPFQSVFKVYCRHKFVFDKSPAVQCYGAIWSDTCIPVCQASESPIACFFYISFLVSWHHIQNSLEYPSNLFPLKKKKKKYASSVRDVCLLSSLGNFYLSSPLQNKPIVNQQTRKSFTEQLNTLWVYPGM